MKIIVISLFSFFLIVNSLGQDIMVTFTAEGEATRIDSISALNQTKHEQITIPGDAILHLRSSSGIQSISGLSEQLSVYPNPFSRTCKALITLTEPQRVKLSVHKLTGQVIVQSDQYLQPGTHELDLALGNTGIYLFILQSDSGISTCKLINLSDSGSEARISYLGQGGDWPGSHMMKTHNSKQGSYELNYTEGDRIHFTCYSGSMTTIFTDVPGYSRDYPVEFADCTDPDDKHYRIVKIGEQTWMEENLAYLPEVSPPSEGSDSLPHFYVYGFDGFDVLDAKEQANYQNYGVLYNWRAILQGEASSSHEPSGVQGICPEGWHLPSVGEWRTLLAYLDTDDHIKLKSTYGWCDTCGGDNSSGFKALPGGLFATNEFYQLGNAGRFWSSTEEISWNLWRAGLGLGSKSSHGASVRCLKNTGHPVASFVYTPTVGTDTTLFHFDASSSFSDETPHEELEFRWDWNGDSIWDTSYNSEKIVSHQFQEAGSYKVVLEVKSTDGQVDTQYRYLTIADGIYVDDRDLNRYYYKSIGKQTWMIENLAYLPYLSDQDPGSEKSAQYYVYAYEGKIVSEARRLPNYQKYGVLYNRMAAASACPLGWHLPSGEELYNLNVYLGDKGFGFEGDRDAIGKAVASASDWDYNYYLVGSVGNGQESNNSSGFNARPGGHRDYNSFRGMNIISYMWSSGLKSYELYGSNIMGFQSYMWGSMPGHANSVRCIKGIGRPSVSTDSVSSKTQSSAVIYSTVLSSGGDNILLAKGVCWSKRPNDPTIADSHTMDGSEIGSFTSQITDLEIGTEYYVRSYAINSVDTAYGNRLTINTVDSTGTFIDPRDYTEYAWVKIRDQIWMAENLAFLPEVHSSPSGSEEFARYYVYGYEGNDVIKAKEHQNYHRYGVLYNYSAAMDGANGSDSNPSEVKGICPMGWHLPNHAEWEGLSSYRYGNAKSLAATSGWSASFKEGDVGNDQASNNSTGFSALPAGRRVQFGVFSGQEDATFFWASNGTYDKTAVSRSLIFSDDKLERNYSSIHSGFSVRCVKGGSKPVASLVVNTNIGGPETVFEFDASACYDQETPSAQLLFRWDWNGDSVWDTDYDTTRIRTHVFHKPDLYTVFMEIKDREELLAKDSVPVIVFDHSLIDPRDGNEYPFQIYGAQTWMTKNLAYLPAVSPSSHGNDSLMHYYVYDYEGNDVNEAWQQPNYSHYGVLYNWRAAIDGHSIDDSTNSYIQGACPDGWHLPSDVEWTAFTDYLTNNGFGFEGSGEDVAKAMASRFGWKESYRLEPGNVGYNPLLNNTSLFTVLPAGRRSHFWGSEGIYSDIGRTANFWTSSKNGSILAWARRLYRDHESVLRSNVILSTGHSVRCLKD